MSAKTTRKCIRIGNARAVVLPSTWCRYFGDRINTLTLFEDGVLIIAPQGLEEVAAKMIERARKNSETEV